MGILKRNKKMKQPLPAFYFLLMLFSLVVGCTGINPVKGWKMWNAQLNPPNLQNYHNSPNTWYYSPEQIYHIDQAIIDDYQALVKGLKDKYPHLYVSEVDFCEDGTGRHAVKLIVETGPREYKEYFLMYDKSNTRKDVISRNTWNQFHI